MNHVHIDVARACGMSALFLSLLLAPARAAAIEQIKVGGTAAATGSMRILAREFTATNPDIQVTLVPSLGSAGSIKAVVAGAIDLALSSRPMSERERASGAVETEYARTPFVFAVSTKSAVTAITSDQLAEIYSGKLARWPDGTQVRIVLRPASDIDTELVKSVSTAVRRALEAAEARPGVRFSVNDQNAADDLEAIPGAIGPSSMALITSERRPLRPLVLDGKEPSLANAVSGAYPFHKRLFFVTGAKRSNAVERFIGFVQSSAGRKILEDNGQWIP